MLPCPIEILRRARPLLAVLLAVASLAASASGAVALADQETLKARLTEATRDIQDLRLVARVVEKSKDAAQKIDPEFGQLCEFETITLSMFFGNPPKMRIEGKLGMVDFAYIINGSYKIVRAPKLRFSKKSDYSAKPSKLQGPLDVGLVTPAIWKLREIEIVEDESAAAEGQIKLRLRWPNCIPFSYIWIDSTTLGLTRLEKYDGDGKQEMVALYSNHTCVAPGFYVPTRIEMFAPTGEKAGALEYAGIKLNSGLPESLFE